MTRLEAFAASLTREMCEAMGDLHNYRQQGAEIAARRIREFVHEARAEEYSPRDTDAYLDEPAPNEPPPR